MVNPRDARRHGLGGLGAVTLGLLAGGTLLQRRHMRQIREDPEHALLESPPRGRPLEAVSADGTRLHAEVFGPEDGPAVVLAHGWTEALQYWVYVIRELTEAGVRVIAFDLRGHGESGEAAGGDYSLERFGEDMEAVLDASLREGERTLLAGHSLGAMSIVAWAQDHDVQRRVEAVALLNTGVEGLIAENVLVPFAIARLKEPVGRLFMGAGGPLPRVSTPLTFTAVRFAAFGPEGSPAKVAFYERMLLSCSPRVRSAIGLSLATMNLSSALSRLTVPTLVLAGESDKLTPPRHAQRMFDALPQPAGLVELPQTGHMAPLERPAEVAAAVLDLQRRAAS